MTRKELEMLARETAPVIRDFVAAQLAPLLERIADLERRESDFAYRGVWQAANVYRTGNFVTHDGSLWHANRDTSERPGVGDGWSLCVKRGKDGKDSPR